MELGPLATKLAEHRALGPLKQIQVELEKARFVATDVSSKKVRVF